MIRAVACQEMNQLHLRTLGRVPRGREIGRASKSYLTKHLVKHLAWSIKNKLGLI